MLNPLRLPLAFDSDRGYRLRFCLTTARNVVREGDTSCRNASVSGLPWLFLVLSARVLAADIAVPPDLQAWHGWVLQDEEFRRCPYIAGTQATDAAAFQCAWPERLVLDLDAKGGRFAQRWELFAETWIGLPGDLEHWPHDVQVDATRAVVVLRNGTPQVRLSAGSHSVSGSFRWARRPESLAVPAQAGIIALALDGQASRNPRGRATRYGSDSGEARSNRSNSNFRFTACSTMTFRPSLRR